MPTLQKIVPFLWFDSQAEEAAHFYTSIFAHSKITTVTPGPSGKAMSVSFQLAGQNFMALNGGPMFQFTEAISLFVNCENQAEIDELWDKLTAGGKPGRCGWLKDKFGVSWQIVPTALGELLGNPDKVKAKQAMQAMLQMNKIDIAGLSPPRPNPALE